MTYKLESGVLTCTLPNGSKLRQEIHPETGEPITEANALDVLRACVDDEQWTQLRIAKYQRRIENSSRLIAEFATDNENRLKSGEWTLAQLQSVIADPQIAELIRLLQSASYQSAIALVQGLQGSVYTDALKSEWAEKIRVAM